MPRTRRLCLPGYPMHIVQRGNNRSLCFLRNQDYVLYLNSLQEMSQKYQVDVHAYVLMTNHVHLLVTPNDPGGVSRMMQQLGRRYVQTFNKYNHRTGTLWEGRFHSTIVDTERYLFACHRYIELNPVRANMVDDPGDYRWSSYRTNALGQFSAVISPRPELIMLGTDRQKRSKNYRQFFHSDVSDEDTAAIRFGTNKGLPVGSTQFRTTIEAKLGIALGTGIPGRPRKTGSEPNKGL